VAGAALAVGALVANVGRLWGDPEVSRGGTPRLYVHRLRAWTALRLGLVPAGLVALAVGAPVVTLVCLLAGEVVGRWLFYVTVVPANMPGSFWRHTAGSHR
jgi:DMSO reductase anchor subunit